MLKTPTPIKGVRADGSVVWFTGDARFVSDDRAEAFAGFNLQGARMKAAKLNAATELHGVRFVAIAADPPLVG